jgi:hypothetical protein
MIPNARGTWSTLLRGSVALAWLATTATAQEAAAPDCVNNSSRPVVSGGTNGVTAIFAIDVDGDTDIDVLSASANDDKIAWFENDGTATSFTEHVVTTNADGAASVYAGDLDGDGDMDIVSASGNDDKIAWYENLEENTLRFVERAIVTTARNAASVFIADVDGDGDQDVLSASIGDDTVAVYERDLAPAFEGTPSFTEVILADFADGVASVYAAEIYLDPDPDDPLDNDDLEVLSAARFDDTIAWYEKVTLADDVVVYIERVIDGNADGATSVYAKDIDGDGDQDVLSASGTDHRIAWYRNDGADPPSFTKQLISTTALGASAVSAADVDGDGDQDVLSASRIDGKIAWYENLGGGDFGDPVSNQQVITTDAPGAASVFAIDLDQDIDGHVDVVAASSVVGAIASNDKIAWHENDGNPDEPLFAEREISGGAVAPEALLAVDVDGAGGIDIVAASAVDDTIVWFANDAMAPPSFTENLLTRDAPEARDLFWADVDGDLTMDVVAALAGDDSIAWYRNLGDGNFGVDPDANRRNIARFTAVGASSVFAIDVDDDGQTDVLSASANDDKVAWYKNLGGGEFGDLDDNARIISEAADGAQSVFAIDLDGDGDVDVLSASSEDDSIRWFESDLFDDTEGLAPSPSFTPHLITSSALEARDVFAIDVDDDGDVDVLSASSGDSRIAWYEQVVDGTPPQIVDLEPGETVVCTATYAVTQTDLDAGTITNTATVEALDSDDESVSDDDTLTVSTDSPSSIDIVKSSDLGDEITFTYGITNTGTTTLTDVSVTDPQSGLSGIDCGGGAAEPQIAALGAGAAASCSATYFVTQTDVDVGSITNTATAAALDPAVSDSDTLTVRLDSSSSIDVAKSSDALPPLALDDVITYSYAVTNTGTTTLTDASVRDSQLGLSAIECGEIAFLQRTITLNAFRARAVMGIDVDGDDDIDVVSVSSGDDTIAWYQSDLLDDPDDVTPPPSFTERVITTSAESARAVAVADVGRSASGVDGAIDFVTGFLFEIAWHASKPASTSTRRATSRWTAPGCRCSAAPSGRLAPIRATRRPSGGPVSTTRATAWSTGTTSRSSRARGSGAT